MKMKKICILVTIVLLVICIIEVILPNSPICFVKKAEGSIPYNENNFYTEYNGYFLECSGDGKITQYAVSATGGNNTFQKTKLFHLNYPVKKYISGDLFVTEDDSIMFGDIRKEEHRKLGTVPNAENASVITDHDDEPLRAAVVTSDGLLYVQGDNSTGALGLEAEHVNSEFVQVPYLKNVVKVVCGINCMFVLNSDGEVFLSGTLRDVFYQRFTKLEVSEKIKDIGASWRTETLIALGVDGNVYELGVSFFSQDYVFEESRTKNYEVHSSLHRISKLKNIASFSSRSGMEAFAIDTNGKAFVWGSQMKKGKFIDLENIFQRIYGLPKYDKIWFIGNFHVLSSDNEITAYTW